jgi:hypothetical protein
MIICGICPLIIMIICGTCPLIYHDYLRYRPNIIIQLQPPHVYHTAQQNMAAINCRERYTSIGIAVPTFANKRSQHVSKQQYH